MILLADANRKYPNSRLLVSSADRGWQSIYAELRTHPAGRLASHTQPNVEIVIALHDSKDGCVIRTNGGRRERTRPTIGTIWLVPAGLCHEEIELSTPTGKTLHLYLPPPPSFHHSPFQVLAMVAKVLVSYGFLGAPGAVQKVQAFLPLCAASATAPPRT